MKKIINEVHLDNNYYKVNIVYNYSITFWPVLKFASTKMYTKTGPESWKFRLPFRASIKCS